MNITSLTSALPPTPGSSLSNKAPSPVQSRPAGESSTVTISAEGSRRYLDEARVERQKDYSFGLHLDPERAAEMAKYIAYKSGMSPYIDARGNMPGGDGVLRYMDGTPITRAGDAYFNIEATRFRAEQIQLYESELAKGTPPADIYDKLISAREQQPERFAKMAWWI